MIQDYTSLAWENLKTRKLRTTLTIIGISIGIAAIIALISVSQGLENAISEQFEKIGSNRLYVQPEGAGDPQTRAGLTQDDADALENVAELSWVTPYLIGSGTVEFGKESEFLGTITGIPTSDLEKRWADVDIKLAHGRYFMSGEKSAAIIGSQMAKEGFDSEIRINNNLYINGKKFTVVGIMEEIGNSDDDNRIMIPLESARIAFNKTHDLTVLELVVKDGRSLEQAAKKVEKVLSQKRGSDDFEVITPQQILDQLGTILTVIQVVLVGIAAISLIVGAIGIMNSMYTAVLERTREIGIMKSIGATNATIVFLFMLESGIIGFLGGIMGIMGGITLSYTASWAAAGAGFSLLKIMIDPFLLAFGMCFSLTVGIASGALPARHAARLPPTEALRY